MKQIIYLSIYLLLFSCKNAILAYESFNASITPRIVGGEDADMRVHSYTLSLRHHGVYFCTACGIREDGVLSAAHCFTKNPNLTPPYLDVTVHSGTASLQELGRIHEVEEVIIHPEFTGTWESSMLHDLVYIRLKENSKIEYVGNQRKANLPTQDVVSARQAIMTGWGRMHPNAETPAARLQMLQMQTLNYKDCQPFMDKEMFKQQLCAFHSAGHGCGHGDSGGPLVYEQAVIGIFSWFRKGMCGTGAAEAFTNVFAERGFLQSVMGGGGGSSSSSKKSKKASPDCKKKRSWIPGRK